MKGYDHREIEQKWQKQWEEDELYKTPDELAGKGPKTSNDVRAGNYYQLVEFVYPSGNLHVGHWYAFAIPDMHARYRRMKGENVLFPMGFDSFGLPAENAAIKHKKNPRDWTNENISDMRRQLRTMGASFDWSREVVTSEPNYYKWTQWLFLEFLGRDLAYRAEQIVNWCPSCKTVLANEQVIAGHCERCDSEVEQRKMPQWALKITDYADRLLEDLEELDWPEPIKEAQRQWIGKSEGALIPFELKAKSKKLKASIEVFTTRADTLFGATYLVLSPEHEEIPNIKSQITNWDEVEEYIRNTQKKTERERQEQKEKTGVELEGIKAINPGTGKEIPVCVADYVLGTVGTGAIMAVPAHDERDYAFAKKHQLPITSVIEPVTGEKKENEEYRQSIVAVVENPKTNKVLCINWGEKLGGLLFVGGGVDGSESLKDTAVREIAEETGYRNVELISQTERIHHHYFAASKGVHRGIHATGLYFRLTDEKRVEPELEENEKGKFQIEWCTKEKAGASVTDPLHRYVFERLVLGKVYTGEGFMTNSGEFDGMTTEEAREKMVATFGTKKTTYKMRDWGVSRQRYWGCPIPVIHCQKCGIVPVSESDLPVELPEMEDFAPHDDGRSPLARAEEWVKVTCPSCGANAKRETDTFDTFVDSSWYFLRYLDPHNEKEFAARDKQKKWMPIDCYSGGAEHTTMHLLYSRFFHKVLFDAGLVDDVEPYVRRMNRSIILGTDGRKMSKRWGNVIDPDAEVALYGADTVRMYLAFIGPYNEVGSYPWSAQGIKGVRRFLERVWRLRLDVVDEGSGESERALHKTIKDVEESVTSFKFNTAVAYMMSFVNTAEKEGITAELFEVFLRVLAPFAPHLAEELWHELGHRTSIHREPWPDYNEMLLEQEEVTIVVQIDGKVRGQFQEAPDLSEEEAKTRAREVQGVEKWLSGKEIVKEVYVPGRLVSIVTQ